MHLGRGSRAIMEVPLAEETSRAVWETGGVSPGAPGTAPCWLYAQGWHSQPAC